jgi:hypothetical protein
LKKLLLIQKILFHITLFSEALPFIALLLFFKRIPNKGKREFFIYSLITAVSVLCLFLFNIVYPNKNIYYLIVRIHRAIEFSLLTYIYALFLRNAIIKKIFILAIIPFIIFCLVDYISSKGPQLPYVQFLIECLFFIIVIIYFFFEKMKQEANEPLFQTFIFWFAVAFIINFAGNFLLYVYSETSNKDADFKTNYTIIYSTVTIIKNILLCIAVTIKEIPNKQIISNNTFVPNPNSLIFTPDKTSSI